MNLASHNDCTGCAACVNVCPFGALSMTPDDEGFLRPVVDAAKCKNCGKCESVCPILQRDKFRPIQVEDKKIASARHLDEKVWKLSTSGGAFTAICEAWDVDGDAIIFGARFDSNFRVVHDYVVGSNNIAPFRKSKYIQSEIGNSFKRVKEFLVDNKRVVFSGTPCQIAALRTFLGRDYENLLLVEFICHGVGSPAVFRKAINEMSQHEKHAIISYTFRSKRGWPEYSGYVNYHEYNNGSGKLVLDDLYNIFFIGQYCMRRSCMENCKYRNPSRYADLTIADSRGEKIVNPEIVDNYNRSVVVANTEKGVVLFEDLAKFMEFKRYTFDLLASTNPLYFHTTKGCPRRDEFFTAFLHGKSLVKLQKRFLPKDNMIWSFAKRGVRKCLRIVKNIVKRILGTVR